MQEKGGFGDASPKALFFFLKKFFFFGSFFPKKAFRKFTSEILRVLQIYQNTLPPPFIYPNSNKKQPKAKICANTLPKLHQGSNHIAIQHSKAHKSLNL